MYRKYKNLENVFINMQNCILITFNYIIWYFECFSPKKFALPRNITKITIENTFAYIFKSKSLNKDYSHIQATNTQETFHFLPA